MKKQNAVFLCILLLLGFFIKSQNSNGYKAYYLEKALYLNYQTPLYMEHNLNDSLEGFNVQLTRKNLVYNGVAPENIESQIEYLKKVYLNSKYGNNLFPLPSEYTFKSNASLSNIANRVGSKNIGSGSFVDVFPCVNEDFELTPLGVYTTSNAVTGWTINSMQNLGCVHGPWNPGSPEFSIVGTPIANFPNVGAIPNSPLGGTRVARLNNNTPSSTKTKIAKNFPVTSANTLFQFAIAGFFQSGSISCCSATGFFTNLIDCNNNPIPCGIMNIGPTCSQSPITFSATMGGFYTNWQVISIDLTPYIGTCVTFEAWCTDNLTGGSYATVLFDARCGSTLGGGMTPVNGNTISSVNYCPNSGFAQITAPPGYSTYSWTASASLTPLPTSQVSLATITVSNPVIGGVYSVNCITNSSCSVLYTYSIVPTQVSIFGIGSLPSCALGNGGSATVQATGSNLGYNYQWASSGNSVVSTASVATGLSPGVYNVTVSVPGNTACGVASASTTVQIGIPPPLNITKPFCGSIAYLSAIGGNNFQWYNGLIPVSGPSGTSSTLIANNPPNYSIYRLGFNNGVCRDSIEFNLVQSPTGTLSTLVSGSSCFGIQGASAIINYTPTTATNLNSPNSYSVISLGSLIPPYSSSSNGTTTATSFSVSNLTAGYSYSVTAFDGNCFAGTSFIVNPITPTFVAMVIPNNTTVCIGNSQSAGVSIFGIPSSELSFSWSPTTFLAVGNSTMQNIVVTPTALPGTSGSIIYSVVATPTLANCPVTATYSIFYVNPLVPAISAIPALCKNSPNYTINTNPQGGNFAPLIFTSGIINPLLLSSGLHTLTYTTIDGGCVSSVTSSFAIYPTPTINVAGNFSLCSNTQGTLIATGADLYSWSNSQSGSSISINPLTSTVYSVVGTNTLGNCLASQILTVAVFPSPTLAISSETIVCLGEKLMLTVNGADTYTWNTNENTNSIEVAPTVQTIFTVTGKIAASNCTSSLSTTIFVSKCAGVDYFPSKKSSVIVYPNPFQDYITIESGEISTLIIYNALGQIILRTPLNEPKSFIDLSSLANGVYFLIFENATSYERIQLQKLNK